jgi:hypothetical protein
MSVLLSAYFSLSHKPECVPHREIGAFCESVVAGSALVIVVRSSSPYAAHRPNLAI